MAKVTVVGNAVVITSSVKLEDIKRAKKYRPEALILLSEDGKEPIFRVGTVSGNGGISKYGVEFAEESRDSEKRAVLTLGFETKSEDLKKGIVDAIGESLIKLNKVEENVASVLGEITNEEQRLYDSITIL